MYFTAAVFRNQGRNEGGTMPRAPKSPNRYFLQYSTFYSQKTSGSNMGPPLLRV